MLGSIFPEIQFLRYPLARTVFTSYVNNRKFALPYHSISATSRSSRRLSRTDVHWRCAFWEKGDLLRSMHITQDFPARNVVLFYLRQSSRACTAAKNKPCLCGTFRGKGRDAFLKILPETRSRQIVISARTFCLCNLHLTSTLAKNTRNTRDFSVQTASPSHLRDSKNEYSRKLMIK